MSDSCSPKPKNERRLRDGGFESLNLSSFFRQLFFPKQGRRVWRQKLGAHWYADSSLFDAFFYPCFPFPPPFFSWHCRETAKRHNTTVISFQPYGAFVSLNITSSTTRIVITDSTSPFFHHNNHKKKERKDAY